MSTLKKPLRSERWLGRNDFRSFNHRSRVMQMGYDKKDWEGKPLIAIVNSWSDYNPCHMHFKQRVDDVKRGVLQAGGFPLTIPRAGTRRPSHRTAAAGKPIAPDRQCNPAGSSASAARARTT